MKKILGIIVLSLVFYVNPLTISDSNAGWFSDPLEKCMNRVIKGTFNGNERLSADAAQLCAGANEGTNKCMSRVIKGTFNGNERLSADAAQLCLGN